MEGKSWSSGSRRLWPKSHESRDEVGEITRCTACTGTKTSTHWTSASRSGRRTTRLLRSLVLAPQHLLPKKSSKTSRQGNLPLVQSLEQRGKAFLADYPARSGYPGVSAGLCVRQARHRAQGREQPRLLLPGAPAGGADHTPEEEGRPEGRGAHRACAMGCTALTLTPCVEAITRTPGRSFLRRSARIASARAVGRTAAPPGNVRSGPERVMRPSKRAMASINQSASIYPLAEPGVADGGQGFHQLSPR
jgi:hypothetical protein